jgi:hypothetical protein
MARRWDSLAAVCTGARREGVGALVGAKGATQGLGLGFYRERRGRGATAKSNGHQWPWGADNFNTFKGGLEWRVNERGD